MVRREEDAFAGKAVHATVEAWVTFQGRAFLSPSTWCAPRQASLRLGWCFSTSPRCAGPLPALRGAVRLGIGGGLLPLRGRLPGQRGFHLKAGGLFQVDRSLPTAPGKLALWAWGASVVREYLAACPEIDQRPWLWRAIPAWARPRCWPAPWTSASSLCSPTSPAAPVPPCTGASRGDRRGHPAGVPLLVQPQLRQLHRGPRAAPFDQHFLLSLIAPEAVRFQRGGRPLVRPRRGVFGLPGGVSRLRGGRRPGLVGAGRSPSWARPATRGTSATTCGRASISSAGRIGASSRRICFSTGKNKGTPCQSASNMV